MKVGKEIALEAKKSNLCQPWFKEMMGVTNYERLAKMYFDGSDWAMEKDFPNVELLRKHKGGIEPHNLLVDVIGRYDNFSKVAFFGNSDIECVYTDYQVAQIYVRHDSKMQLTAKYNSIVYVNILDNAELVIDCQDNAQVIVFEYGNNTKIAYKGNVKVKPSNFE